MNQIHADRLEPAGGAVALQQQQVVSLKLLWMLDGGLCWTHHADGPEGHEAVAAVGVAPGVPARILSLLQDEHLPTEVSLLEGDKAAGGIGQERGVRPLPRKRETRLSLCPLTGRTPR